MELRLIHLKFEIFNLPENVIRKWSWYRWMLIELDNLVSKIINGAK